MTMLLQYQCLDPRLGVDFPLPAYATECSAGIDLLACIEAPWILEPDAVALVPSGVAVALSASQVGMIFPRSGLGHRHGIILGNSVGVVDPDYRGEIMVSLWNRSQNPYVIHPGDRIAQFVIMPIDRPQWVQVSTLPSTDRGVGGFGSTGR